MTVVWSCGCSRRVLVVEARYDAVADFYAAGWPDSGDDPVARALLGLCGDVAGERVLDLACGHGRITRQLAGRGAIVTGIDISARRTQPLSRWGCGLTLSCILGKPADYGRLRSRPTAQATAQIIPFGAVLAPLRD